MSKIWTLLRELRRRHVFRAAGLYVVGAWVFLQVIALAFQSFGILESALGYVWIAVAVAFPLVVIFGWRYEITGRGMMRTAPTIGTEDLGLRRQDYMIIASLAFIAVTILGGTIRQIQSGAGQRDMPWYSAERMATSIAVLPLENLSGDEDQNFLTAGLHDSLITTLSRITLFRVTSRYSSRRLRDDLSLPDIQNILGVDKILTGSVLREGDQVRVNVTLTDLDTEQAIWADSFVRDFDGLIAIQNEVASAVAREVKVTLTPEEERRLTAADTKESETYEIYLKGMFQLHRGSTRAYRRAIEIFTEAVENNPTSALAYAGLAISYAQLGHSPYPASGAYPRAREAAQRALEYDPELAEAHLAIGMYKMYYEWDFAGSEAALLRALELNPSLVDAHYHYAWLLELLLRDEEALAFGKYTVELNPLSPFFSCWLADQYRDAGQFDLAIREAKVALELNPRYPVCWLSLGWSYLDTGRVDEAIEAHEHLRESTMWGFALAQTYATAARNEDAEEVRQFIDNGKNNAFTLALIYGGLQDRDRTLEYLEKARDEKIPWYPWLVTWFQPMQFLRDDPRMRQFAEELGLEFALADSA